MGYFAAARKASEAKSDAFYRAANRLEEMNSGATIDTFTLQNRYLGVDHGNHALIRGHLDAMCRDIEEYRSDRDRYLARIEDETNTEIASSPPQAHAAIIATGRARQQAAWEAYREAVRSRQAQAAGQVEPLDAVIMGRGGAPTAPAPSDTRDSGGARDRAEKPEPGAAKQNGEEASSQGEGAAKPGAAKDIADRGSVAGAQSGGTVKPGGAKDIADAVPPPAVSPVGTVPGSGLGSAGGGGLGASGLSPAASGRLGSAPGLGAVSGMGGAVPPAGVGQMSAPASALGPAVPASGAPVAASAGAAAAPGVAVPSTPATSGPALSPPLSVPATGIGSAPSTSPPVAGLGASGLAPGAVGASGVAPASAAAAGAAQGPAASAGVETATSGMAPAPVMLPPPGMGAPAAPVAGGGAMPAGSAGAGGLAGGPAAPTGAPMGAATPSAAVVVPSVVSADAGARRRSVESPELGTAKALARKLRRDSDAVGYPFIEWAVGVFRADAGGATECVVMSNEGFAYVPWGVFLPRTARTLAADKLVDDELRARWFSWPDPTYVVGEYARLREDRGARLVALAATADSPALHATGVESAVCRREWEAGVLAAPTLDDMHQHRLETLHPDIYGRIQRLAGTAARYVENQLIVPLAAGMIENIKMTANVEYPEPLRQMWNMLGTGNPIPAEAWNDYRLKATTTYATTSAERPDAGADTGQRELYRAQWRVARAVEIVGGWAWQPVAWADMLYAAAVFGEGDFVGKAEQVLRDLEAERKGS